MPRPGWRPRDRASRSRRRGRARGRRGSRRGRRAPRRWPRAPGRWWGASRSRHGEGERTGEAGDDACHGELSLPAHGPGVMMDECGERRVSSDHRPDRSSTRCGTSPIRGVGRALPGRGRRPRVQRGGPRRDRDPARSSPRPAWSSSTTPRPCSTPIAPSIARSSRRASRWSAAGCAWPGRAAGRPSRSSPRPPGGRHPVGVTFLVLDALHMLAIADAGHEEEWAEVGLRRARARAASRAPAAGASRCTTTSAGTCTTAGGPQEALPHFERALEYARDVGTAEQRFIGRWAIARCLRTLGRTDEALVLQRSLAEKRPDDPYVAAEIAALTEDRAYDRRMTSTDASSGAVGAPTSRSTRRWRPCSAPRTATPLAKAFGMQHRRRPAQPLPAPLRPPRRADGPRPPAARRERHDRRRGARGARALDEERVGAHPRGDDLRRRRASSRSPSSTRRGARRSCGPACAASSPARSPPTAAPCSSRTPTTSCSTTTRCAQRRRTTPRRQALGGDADPDLPGDRQPVELEDREGDRDRPRRPARPSGDPVPASRPRGARAARPRARRSSSCTGRRRTPTGGGARDSLRFAEAFVLQAALLQERAVRRASATTPRVPTPGGLLERFDASLPFALTGDQEDGRRRDRRRPRRDGSDEPPRAGRGRLGQDPRGAAGDARGRRLRRAVGAARADRGARGAAPALDRAHARPRSRRPSSMPTLLTGQLSARRAPQGAAARGHPARRASSSAPTPCSARRVSFYDLGLVVVDEQHRFGVDQREALRLKGARPARARAHGHADPAHGRDDGVRRPRRRASSASCRPAAPGIEIVRRARWPRSRAGGIGSGSARPRSSRWAGRRFVVCPAIDAKQPEEGEELGERRRRDRGRDQRAAGVGDAPTLERAARASRCSPAGGSSRCTDACRATRRTPSMQAFAAGEHRRARRDDGDRGRRRRAERVDDGRARRRPVRCLAAAPAARSRRPRVGSRTLPARDATPPRSARRASASRPSPRRSTASSSPRSTSSCAARATCSAARSRAGARRCGCCGWRRTGT